MRSRGAVLARGDDGEDGKETQLTRAGNAYEMGGQDPHCASSGPAINANLRRRTGDKLAEVKRINGDMADIAMRIARQPEAVVRNARRKLGLLDNHASGRAHAAVDTLEHTPLH
jgi:hypothetical protein